MFALVLTNNITQPANLITLFNTNKVTNNRGYILLLSPVRNKQCNNFGDAIVEPQIAITLVFSTTNTGFVVV